MQLDKTKKYEFCGEVYEAIGCNWASVRRAWHEADFQFFADHGHVKEVREPLVFDVEIEFDDNGLFWSLDIPFEARKGKTYKVKWTEVVK